MELRFTRFTQIKRTAKQTRSMTISTKCMAFAEKARALMAQHGLTDWSFAYNKRKCHLGLCFNKQRRIELSVYLVDNNSEAQSMDILLHEIAHALAGHAAGHGPKWQSTCLRIGAKPNRCCGTASMPATNRRNAYVACCPRCYTKYVRYRMSHNGSRFYYCTKCGPTDGRLSYRKIGLDS